VCADRTAFPTEGVRGSVMLKITLRSEAGVLFFQLEGKLAGPWVKELERCWRLVADTQLSYPVRVGLSPAPILSC
jgi:hypothetical protein